MALSVIMGKLPRFGTSISSLKQSGLEEKILTLAKLEPIRAWFGRHWMWVGLAVSLLATWLALRGLDMAHVWAALAGANYAWLIPALAFHFATMTARSIRWQILLGRDQVDLSTSFWVEHIGYLVANVIHARVGDVARVAVISQRKPVSAAHALSTVVLERLFDLLAVVVMILMLIPLMQIPPEWLAQARVLGVLGLLGVAGAIALVAMSDFSERMVAGLLSRLPGVDPALWLARWRSLVGGFSVVGSVRGLADMLIWTAITWITATGVFWAVLMAFVPQAPFHASAFVLAAEAFGMVVPATPGNWGVFEAIARAALVLPFGVPDSQAVSFGLVVHIFEYVTLNAVGLVGLARYSLSLKQVKEKKL
ncbi:MAG: flippase-like domain-containing protein [Thermoflexales bacterium]|nr:flippase-like domain-containing protein [Thermoflexales bacterium]